MIRISRINEQTVKKIITLNPAAETEPDSPIAGMPVLHVWEAGEVIVFKRSMGNAGYAGVQNPLFFNENTDMLLGDDKATAEAINAALEYPDTPN